MATPMQISPHVHALELPFSIELSPVLRLPRCVYCYLIRGPQPLLVDAGVRDSAESILAAIAALRHEKDEQLTLVCTHSHPDHIGGAALLKESLDLRVAAHADAVQWIENPEEQFTRRPVPGFHQLVSGGVPVDMVLAEGSTLPVGPLSFMVLHTPGHSACSLSLFCPEEGVLITGDALPRPGDLPIYEDLSALLRSLRRLAQISGVQHLLSSLDTPCSGPEIGQRFAASLAWLEKIHGAVRAAAPRADKADPLSLARLVADALPLPEAAVNPLVARSLAAHLPFLDQSTLH